MSPDEMFPFVVAGTIAVAALWVWLRIRNRRGGNDDE
jgi:hypothetical protein